MVVISSILVPVDFSKGSELALQRALVLADRLRAQVRVINVWQPPPYIVPEMVVAAPGTHASVPFDEYMRTRTHKELQAFVDPHQLEHVTMKVAVLAGTPRDVIAKYAEEYGVDLIVMGTHGRTGLRHLLLGSVAEHLIRSQACPVMTVRMGREH